MNTSDGSDNQTLSLCGGATASSARGGRVEPSTKLMVVLF